MQLITDLISGAAQASASAASVKEQPKVQRTEDEAWRRPLKPAMDEYISEEKQEPAGRYWPGRDEDGNPKIYFDDPGRDAGHSRKPDELSGVDDTEKNKKAKGPDKKADDDKGADVTCNTDKVDREIEKLKKKKSELERQLGSETDEGRIKDLENELAQVERELRQKDNDAYRHQYAVYTYA